MIEIGSLKFLGIIANWKPITNICISSYISNVYANVQQK